MIFFLLVGAILVVLQEKKDVENELTTTRKVINEVAANTATAEPFSVL